MPQQQAIIVGLLTLKSGVVLDRGVFKDSSADAMADTITAITNAGKPLLVIDDAKTFFTIPNLIKMVKDNDPRHALIAEALDANGQFIDRSGRGRHGSGRRDHPETHAERYQSALVYDTGYLVVRGFRYIRFLYKS